MVDLPAPEGDESTISRPRRRRVGWSMTTLASGKPWPSSDEMLRRTRKTLKCCGAPYIVQCNIFRGMIQMVDETKVQAQAAAEAPAKVAEAVAETVETITKESAKVAKRTRAAGVRAAKRQASSTK